MQQTTNLSSHRKKTEIYSFSAFGVCEYFIGDQNAAIKSASAPSLRPNYIAAHVRKQQQQNIYATQKKNPIVFVEF